MFNYLENHDRQLNIEEARYNLATRIMSNGVGVIVAGDKTTYPGEPNIRRIQSTASRPHTLPPSTLTDHMLMMLPQDASDGVNYIILKLNIYFNNLIIIFRWRIYRLLYIKTNLLQKHV